MSVKSPQDLRSFRWYGVDDLRSFGHRSRTKQIGYAAEDFAGKPVIGIINTWSEANPCHIHLRQRADEVKRGVWQAGGFPMEIPALSPGETMMKPTTMLYRNLLAMEVEELARSNPLDGLVLLGGCDKSIPALLMGAATMDLPSIIVPAGPMLRGHWRGDVLGSGSDVWKYWDERRAGKIGATEWSEIEDGIARSFGTCMTMGTASTMAFAAEAMGMTLPGAAAIPAPDSSHARLASASGRCIVDMVWQDRKPSDIVTLAALENAVRTVMACGGSTNSIVHFLALAGRFGLPLDLARLDVISRETPLILNLRPSGKYLMEDLYYAGGSRAVLNRLGPLLALEAITVNGNSLGENVAGAEVLSDDVVKPLNQPMLEEGGLAVLTGNLAPQGAVIKHNSASAHLLTHTGPALVFEDYNDMSARIDDPDLDVTADSVLVLRQAGPLGGPGMPEWGMLPMPKKLLKQGVRDMVRLSDARMSGTSYGTCVLHIAPESHLGGPLALVKTGDLIKLDVPARRLDLLVSDAELAARKAAWVPRESIYPRGYGMIYSKHVTQADKGCDFDFLERTEKKVPEPEIH